MKRPIATLSVAALTAATAALPFAMPAHAAARGCSAKHAAKCGAKQKAKCGAKTAPKSGMCSARK